MSEKNKERFVFELTKRIGKYLITSTDLWFNLCQSTMGEILKSPKRVLLVFHNYLTIFENCETYGIFPEKNRFINVWHNTNNTDVLVESIEKNLIERK